jgi:hypothetical protein
LLIVSVGSNSIESERDALSSVLELNLDLFWGDSNTGAGIEPELLKDNRFLGVSSADNAKGIAISFDGVKALPERDKLRICETSLNGVSFLEVVVVAAEGM